MRTRAGLLWPIVLFYLKNDFKRFPFLFKSNAYVVLAQLLCGENVGETLSALFSLVVFLNTGEYQYRADRGTGAWVIVFVSYSLVVRILHPDVSNAVDTRRFVL